MVSEAVGYQDRRSLSARRQKKQHCRFAVEAKVSAWPKQEKFPRSSARSWKLGINRCSLHEGTLRAFLNSSHHSKQRKAYH